MADEQTNAADADLPVLDVQTVAVIWVDSVSTPTVSWTCASVYEAIGMLRAAASGLERDYPIFSDQQIDEDEDDDEDDEYA